MNKENKIFVVWYNWFNKGIKNDIIFIRKAINKGGKRGINDKLGVNRISKPRPKGDIL